MDELAIYGYEQCEFNDEHYFESIHTMCISKTNRYVIILSVSM